MIKVEAYNAKWAVVECVWLSGKADTGKWIRLGLCAHIFLVCSLMDFDPLLLLVDDHLTNSLLDGLAGVVVEEPQEDEVEF